MNIGKMIDKRDETKEVVGIDKNSGCGTYEMLVNQKKASGIDKLSYGQVENDNDRKVNEITKTVQN